MSNVVLRAAMPTITEDKPMGVIAEQLQAHLKEIAQSDSRTLKELDKELKQIKRAIKEAPE